MPLARCPTCGSPCFEVHSAAGTSVVVPAQPAHWAISVAAEELAAGDAGFAAMIDAAVWELRRRELEALIGAPPLPAGWTWQARLDMEQAEHAWVLRSTLLPVPVLEGDERA